MKIIGLKKKTKERKTTMFKINLKDVDVVIALGEISKKVEEL